ncbi:hypothetical protein BJV38_000281 [Clostridium beijerinckii]|uniref:Uncharacterized protein n=1 Tax=Clostridium beijerinckii TaxID=1520 RepID=A0AAX0BA08_CLOBE|nr:hypothetical protein [Clostridium beijerinckii]NRT43438.1 hypothetical protein [Clostridium beijerinckii]NRT91299.1 hypothetical protein [Clostridium beijerinckii]NRZ22571.1 hypothetical protein [Clostridium beijerinckii]
MSRVFENEVVKEVYKNLASRDNMERQDGINIK